MLVGAANEQDIGTSLPSEAGVHIGGQQRADEIAEMLDAVDVGNGARDEIAGHVRILAGGRRTPRNQKALPLWRKSSGSAPCLARTRVNPSGHLSRGRAGAFVGRR